MSEEYSSKEERIQKNLKFIDSLNEIFLEEYSPQIFERIIQELGNHFQVNKISFVKCFGINFWEVRYEWSSERKILKNYLSGNWEEFITLYSYLSTGSFVTDDIAEFSPELEKWKKYFRATNILILPYIFEKKLSAMFVFQDVKKKFFYEDEILLIKSIVYRLINLLELSEKIKFLQASNRELRNEVNDLSNLLNLVPAVIVQKNETLKYENVNDNFINLVGKKKFDIIGRTDAEIFPQEISDELFKYDLEAIESGKSSSTVHKFILDNREYYFAYHRIVFFDRNDETKHLLIVGINITEIFTAKIQSELASKTKSEFLANMSHELRTPLNSIIGFTELLLQEKLTEEQKEIVSNIRQSSYSLLELINDILDLNKIEAGKIEINPISVSISSLLHEIDNMFRARFQQKKLYFRIIIEDNVPEYIMVDPLRLKQVIINLVGNAIKFTNQGGVELRIENLSNTKFIGQTINLQFSVKDTGLGIPEKKLSLIFEAFTQAEKDTAQKFGGTGLGLTISKRLVELMGGEISVESKVGEGSLFKFVIPVEITRPTKEKEEISTIKIEEIIGAESPRAPLILIIEDDLEIAKLFEHHFKQKEFKMIISQSAADGLRNAIKYHPDLILLDIFLSDKSGWELLREIKSDVRLKSIPVIICSVERDLNKAYNLGAIDYLEKPVSVKKLEELVTNIKKSYVLNERIVCVDDDINTLNRLDKILTKYDLTTECFDDPEIALKKLIDSKPPSLIILDLMMPKIDGFQFLAEIRKRDDLTTVPVVILTSKKLIKEEIDFLKEKSSSIFFKDKFNENEFFQTLDQILETIQKGKSSIIFTERETKSVEIEKPAVPPLHILLVEDNLMNQKFMSHILKRLGATFEIASDGKDAIEKIKSNHYDLVLMDVQMPVMDGLEATKYIRQELKLIDLPIIALTAHAMKGDKEKCLAAGCNGYIPKPIDQQKLVTEIMNVIKKSEPSYDEISPYFQGFSREEIIQLRTDYINQLRKDIEELDKKLSPKEFESFRYFGHNIKGNGVAYGFPEISKFGEKIELASESQDYPSLVTVFNELKTFLNEIKI